MRYQDTGNYLAWFCGGASLGALLTYLFDPDMGQKRRSVIAESARDTFGNVGENVSSSLGNVRSSARQSGRSIMAGVAALGSNLGQQGGRIRQRVERSGSTAVEEAGERLRFLLQGRRALPSQPVSLASKAIASLGLLAAGMGVMYLLDPVGGRRRRAMIRDKMVSAYGTASDRMAKTGRDVWNRTSGTVAELRGRMRHTEADDKVLADRVRSVIGRCVANPHAIEVSSLHGVVTLTGPVLERDVDSLLRGVWTVRGVKELVNRLEVHQHAGNIPSLQGTE